MKRILIVIFAGLIVLAGLVYAGDYLSLRFRIPPGREPFGTVTVQTYYEIHEKNGKVEYDYQDPQPEACVNALFPHFGYATCWYLGRHPERKIEI